MHALRMVEHSHADASSTAMNHSALSGFRLSTLLRFIIFSLQISSYMKCHMC